MIKLTLLMTLSLDGRIGLHSDHFVDWAGKEDRKLFVEITKKAGVVIMGSKTFDTISKPLLNRKNIVLTQNKSRKSRWNNLIFTDKGPKKILHNLEKEGFKEVILIGGRTINSLFARENLIDEIIVTIAPVIFGKGISLFSEDISMKLKLKQIEKIGKNLACLRYTLKKERA
ncbi:dihydrofolate reductase [Candidatus Magnetomoraceae bacterium gMMP-15]